MDISKLPPDTQTRVINALLSQATPFAQLNTDADKLAFCQKIVDDYVANTDVKKWLTQKVVDYETAQARAGVSITL